MPIYEYVCEKCGNEFELIVFNKEEAPNCPKCGAENPVKKMSSFGFAVGYKFKPSTSGSQGSCSSCGSSNCSSCG